jgi:hypothetical protein
MEASPQEIELTPEGTVLETVRLVDVKDPVEPVRILVREWIDERHYRSAFVPEVPEHVPEEPEKWRGWETGSPQDRPRRARAVPQGGSRA